MPPSIPADIWTHVSKFIPEYALGSMLRVNSAFFQLVMNARYHEVVFSTFDDAALERIRRLRDPIIALRVHKLHVDMDPVKWLWNSNELARSIPVEEVMQTMTDTIIHFTNLTEFTFDSLYKDERLDECWPSFLTTAWKTFGSNLQKLTLMVVPKTLPTLLSTTDSLIIPMTVRNLCVYLDHQYRQRTLYEIDSAECAKALAQFIDKVAPTRRALSLSSSWYDIELPRLSPQQGNIPSLERHHTFMEDASAPVVPDPLDLTCIIRNHIANLRPLYDLNDTFAHAIGPTDASREQRMLCLLREHGLDVVFSNLLTLRLVVPLGPAAFSLVVQCIKCSADTLTSLGLSSRSLSYDEVNSVACIFSSREARLLQKLDLQANFLSPELILLLAQTFPGLEKLSIRFQQIKAHNGEGDEVNQEDIVLMRNFAEAMKTCDIAHWSLDDIALVKERSFDRDMETMLMWTVAECVPSVKRFRGEDKKFFMNMTL